MRAACCELLDELAEEGDGSSLRDFGHELLPRLVAEGEARAFDSTDTGAMSGQSTATRGGAHGAARRRTAADALYDPAGATLTMGLRRPPAGDLEMMSATIDDGLVARGCTSAEPWRVFGNRPRNVVEKGPRFETPSSSMTACRALARVWDTRSWTRRPTSARTWSLAAYHETQW